MVLAYLLDPLATRLEGLGMNRLIATLRLLLACSLVGVVALIVLTAPMIVKELGILLSQFSALRQAVAWARN